MNIRDIENTLPNGLHDALLKGISIDYENKRADLILSVSVDRSDDDGTMKFQDGRLLITGLVFFIIDPPMDGYPYVESKSVTIDSGPGQPRTSHIELPTIGKDCFLHWFYSSNWNSFIRIAAKEASFSWE